MKLGSEEIFYINTLNSVSNVVARDVVVQGNTITFVVKQEDVGKAVGKNGANVTVLRNQLKKNVEIVGFFQEIKDFVKKALYRAKIKKVIITEDDGKKKAVIILEAGEKRKMLNNMARFKRIKEIAKRNYNLNEMRLK